jgi:ribosomal protein L11 methyltransferase
MRTWPAIDVGRLSTSAEGYGGRSVAVREGAKAAPTPDLNANGKTDVGAAFRRPDLFQAALVDYDVLAVDERSDDQWRVFLQTATERDRALTTLRNQFPALTLDPVDVPDEDWAARSQANLRAIQVGGIVVAPPWDVQDAPHTIVIQPSMGFGTGHHASTRLCLAALQQIDLRQKTVLDVGTGSGVLAIAARMLGALDVLGIDNDPDAVESARENVALNPGVRVELQVVDLKTIVVTPFDVVVANLTGGILMQTADRLQELTASAGRLIISGFTQTEEVGVLAAFRGFHAADRHQEDEWMCAMLQREAGFD